MAVVLALGRLYDTVSASWLSYGNPAGVAQTFGWRQPPRQAPPYPRIVWLPGDDSSGDVGAVVAPRNRPQVAADNGRAVLNVNELFTVYVSAVDKSSAAALADDRKQWQAARELYDAWLRAVYLAAHGTFEILSAKWHLDPTGGTERPYGATIRAVGAILSVVPEGAAQLAPFDTSARVTTTVLDVSEVEDVTPPPP